MNPLYPFLAGVAVTLVVMVALGVVTVRLLMRPRSSILFMASFLRGFAERCPVILIVDGGGMEQAVSTRALIASIDRMLETEPS